MAVLDTGTADAVYQAYWTGENEAEVVVLTDQVNSFLDRVTFGRVMGPLDDDVQGKVDQCANELLAFLDPGSAWNRRRRAKRWGTGAGPLPMSASPRHARRCTGSPAAGWLGPA